MWQHRGNAVLSRDARGIGQSELSRGGTKTGSGSYLGIRGWENRPGDASRSRQALQKWQCMAAAAGKPDKGLSSGRQFRQYEKVREQWPPGAVTNKTALE